MLRCVSMRPPEVRMLGSRPRASTSASVSRGLRKNLQVSSVPSHASKLIGKRETKNVVGPVLSRSLATLSLMPYTGADADAEDHRPHLHRGRQRRDGGDELGEREAQGDTERGADRAERRALDEELAHD